MRPPSAGYIGEHDVGDMLVCTAGRERLVGCMAVEGGIEPFIDV